MENRLMGIEPGAQEISGSGKIKLRIRGVSRSFETPQGSLLALSKIQFEVMEGEFVCIVGPSGSGKSTLLNLIAGLDQPDKGEVWTDGRRVASTGSDRIVIFQELGLFPWLTVQENVEFGLRMRGVGAAERQAKAREYLRLVHLSGFENSLIHQLSGGMKQRVALARSLITEPDVLLMDEPFAALDAQTRDLLHEELERIWTATRKTIVFVTHNVREAVRLGTRVLVMTFRPGRIKSEFPISLPRPRSLEDPELTLRAREIVSQLKAEIDEAVKMEYKHEENR
jgi:sulfonate transport system ATP-binding protein